MMSKPADSGTIVSGTLSDTTRSRAFDSCLHDFALSPFKVSLLEDCEQQRLSSSLWL